MMKFTDKAIAAILSLGSLTFAMPVMAKYPALGWSQRPIDSSIKDCLDRAETALKQAGLQDVAKRENDISGHTQVTSVAIVCNSAGNATILTIMTSGQDSIEAQELQDNLSKQLGTQ